MFTECLTKSNLEKPSDYSFPGWVASVSIDPDISKTQMMDTEGLGVGASGETIFKLIWRSSSITDD